MSKITENQIESSALAVLQRAMEKYAESNGISFEKALMLFSTSKTYNELFDYDSLLWTQGPDYLLGLYEEEKQSENKT